MLLTASEVEMLTSSSLNITHIGYKAPTWLIKELCCFALFFNKCLQTGRFSRKHGHQWRIQELSLEEAHGVVEHGARAYNGGLEAEPPVGVHGVRGLRRPEAERSNIQWKRKPRSVYFAVTMTANCHRVF